MAEVLTLASPVEAPKTVFRVSMIAFDWFNARINIQLREWTGIVTPLLPSGTTSPFGPTLIVAEYSGPEATSLMTALNKTNLSTQSLHQRIMTRLLADGKIPPGTTSGVVD